MFTWRWPRRRNNAAGITRPKPPGSCASAPAVWRWRWTPFAISEVCPGSRPAERIWFSRGARIVRHRVASLAVILSLGLAMGATLAAYRLVDAVLRRPLHVADPSRLFFVTCTAQAVDGSPDDRDDFDYPTYRRYVTLTTGQADLMLVGMAARRSITFDGGDPETVVQQFVSGNVFATLGLRPAVGRLLGEQDDAVPGGHPVVVLSHDYWQRRFASDPAIVGRTFRMDRGLYEIVGVAAKGFTGTEPGAVTDFFVPAMMNPEALKADGWSWFRIWLRPRPGVDPRQVEALLHVPISG